MSIFKNLKPWIARWTVKDTRCLTREEKNAVDKAEVVVSDYGHSVCFFMKSNRPNVYIPLTCDSVAEAGDSVDLDEIELITLSLQGDPNTPEIMRVKV